MKLRVRLWSTPNQWTTNLRSRAKLASCGSILPQAQDRQIVRATFCTNVAQIGLTLIKLKFSFTSSQVYKQFYQPIPAWVEPLRPLDVQTDDVTESMLSKSFSRWEPFWPSAYRFNFVAWLQGYWTQLGLGLTHSKPTNTAPSTLGSFANENSLHLFSVFFKVPETHATFLFLSINRSESFLWLRTITNRTANHSRNSDRRNEKRLFSKPRLVVREFLMNKSCSVNHLTRYSQPANARKEKNKTN